MAGTVHKIQGKKADKQNRLLRKRWNQFLEIESMIYGNKINSLNSRIDIVETLSWQSHSFLSSSTLINSSKNIWRVKTENESGLQVGHRHWNFRYW